MSDTSIALFSLSVLLAIYLSASHIVKRTAPDGKLYVDSSRVGCESVKSEPPCTLTWQLNPFLAKLYKHNNEIVAATTKHYKDRGVNILCLTALEKAQCSQAVPRCFAENGTRDYGDISKVQCIIIKIVCPKEVQDILRANNFCESLKTGKYLNSPCVAASTPITGVCPQPKYKMPSEYLTAYREKSSTLVNLYNELRGFRYENGDRVYSNECILQLEEISCSPTYCSANESQLLIKHDRDDCNKIIKECHDKVISRLSVTSPDRSHFIALKKEQQAICDTYPTASTAKLQDEPPLITLEPVTTLGPVSTPQPVTTLGPASTPQPDTQQQPDTSQRPNTSKQPDTSQQPIASKQPDINTTQQPDNPQQPNTPQPPDTPRKPDIPEQPGKPQKPENRNRRPTSVGTCQLGNHILLTTLTYFVIKIYV